MVTGTPSGEPSRPFVKGRDPNILFVTTSATTWAGYAEGVGDGRTDLGRFRSDGRACRMTEPPPEGSRVTPKFFLPIVLYSSREK